MAWPLVGSLDRLPHLLIGNGQSPLVVDEGLDLGPARLLLVAPTAAPWTWSHLEENPSLATSAISVGDGRGLVGWVFVVR